MNGTREVSSCRAETSFHLPGYPCLLESPTRVRSAPITLGLGARVVPAAMALTLAVALSGCGGDGSETGELERPTEGGATTTAPSSGPSSPPLFLAAPPRELSIDELGYVEGENSAPLRVLEFSDFGCGYCRQFHLEVYPTIEREYVATGKVQWKYIPMILGIFGPAAELAAHAGECAIEQGEGFPAMRDRLFEEQPVWKGASDPLPLLERYARDVGLDVPRWDRCVRDEWRGDRISSGTTLGVQQGVRGTPTFFIVGHGAVPGAVPLDVFRQILDESLATQTEP